MKRWQRSLGEKCKVRPNGRKRRTSKLKLMVSPMVTEKDVPPSWSHLDNGQRWKVDVMVSPMVTEKDVPPALSQ